MRALIIALSLLFCMAFSCKNARPNPEKESGKKFKISGQALVNKPYCGGAAPPRDYEKKPQAYANQVLILKKGAQNSEQNEVLQEIQTDENGQFELHLTAGTYCILKASKNQKFEAFYQKFSTPTSSYYTARAKDCFKEWWTNCEYSFEVVDLDLSINFTLNERCFTGDNPCIDYEGPLPP